jgi:predicted nucleic acid-binding protein
MIVLDTNIVAALMANGADIDAWLDTVPRHELYTTVMTRAEIRYGLARLPAGKRRNRLTEQANAVFSETQERLLPFDAKAADRYGDLVAARGCGSTDLGSRRHHRRHCMGSPRKSGNEERRRFRRLRDPSCKSVPRPKLRLIPPTTSCHSRYWRSR